MSESIDELLERAQGKKKEQRCERDPRVLKYISLTGLEPGVLQVPTYVIYWHYRAIYTYEGLYDQNKAKKVGFFRTFSKRFPQYRKNTQRFYLLNPLQLGDLVEEVDGVYKLKAETLKTAKAYDKNHGQRKRKKTLQLPRQEGNDEN